MDEVVFDDQALSVVRNWLNVHDSTVEDLNESTVEDLPKRKHGRVGIGAKAVG